MPVRNMCVSRAQATGNDLQLNQWLTALVRRNVWRLAHVLQVRNLDWFNSNRKLIKCGVSFGFTSA